MLAQPTSCTTRLRIFGFLQPSESIEAPLTI